LVTTEGCAAAAAVVALHNPLSPSQAQEAYGRVERLLATREGEDVFCDVTGRPDLRTVDVLARLVLITQRGHARLIVRALDSAKQLEELVALSGLDVLDQRTD
jgi:hypothetical protein